MLYFPALASETPGFSDVSPEDWFAPYVEICVEEGLMDGTGEGRFDPHRELTLTEAIVLTARLHARLAGEPLPSYSLPDDPNDLACIRDETGAQVGNFADIQITMMGSPREPMFLCLDNDLLERVGTGAHLTLTIDVRGLEYYTSFRDRFQEKAFVHKSVGYEEHLRPSGELERGYAFAQEEDTLWPLLMGLTHYMESNGDVYRSMADDWWRDENLYLTSLAAVDGIDPFSALETAWAVDENLLFLAHTEGRTWEELAELSEEEFLSWPCLPGDLAALLWAVSGPEVCPPIHDHTPPDTGSAPAVALCQAGILTGVDAQGTFHSPGRVTRAEAAAMMARIMEPSLRISFAPEEDAAVTPFEEDGLYGLKDAAGKVRIPAQYAYLMVEEDGFVIVTDRKGNKGILDTEGNVVLPCLYPRIYNSPDEEGLVVVGSAGDYASPLHYNGKKGMINTRGDVVIPLEYDFLTPFEYGQASFLRRSGAETVFGHLRPDGTELPLTAEEVAQDDPLYLALHTLGLVGS